VAATDWREVIRHPEVGIVVVATTNDLLAAITLAAVQAGKHVLVEKPAARRPAEMGPVMEAARQANRLVRVGFNHRYHPEHLLYAVLGSLFITGGVMLLTQSRGGWFGLAVGLLLLFA
jgi:predicted dehydrogenase